MKFICCFLICCSFEFADLLKLRSYTLTAIQFQFSRPVNLKGISLFGWSQKCNKYDSKIVHVKPDAKVFVVTLLVVQTLETHLGSQVRAGRSDHVVFKRKWVLMRTFFLC